MFNIIQKNSKEFMLGESLGTYAQALVWLNNYTKKYPQFQFEIVEVTFKHPDWFPEELRRCRT